MTNATVIKKPTMQIRTQKYTQIAYPLVEAIQGSEIETEYRTLALNLPTMIMQSGLSQTIGFLLAKSKMESDNPNKTKPMAFAKILEHLTILLKYEIGDGDLNDVIIQSNITQYQLLTRKAIEASSWIKRYTQALLEK